MSGPGEGFDPKEVRAAGEKLAAADPVKEDAPRFVLPPLDRTPKSFYDTEAKAMWIGIPVGYVDPFFASVFLDASKLEFVKHTQREMPAMIEAEKRKASLLGKAREGVGSMMSRLGGLVGR